MLSRMGTTAETFFSKTTFLGTHDKAIEAVAEKLVDGAAVDSLIWEYANRTSPKHTSRTRIVRKSEPYGIPPVVVRPGLDPALKARLREIFLSAHQDPEGAALLKKMSIERFVAGEDSAYDSVRKSQEAVAKAKAAAGK